MRTGGKGDEKISCVLYDSFNKHIIVAGNSTSDDFANATIPEPIKEAPAGDPKKESAFKFSNAFAYAVDLEGNYIWGKYFRNETLDIYGGVINTISGCDIDDLGNIVMYGLAKN